MVVVPSSVLDNWDSELQKFCPSLKTVKYHGSQKERANIRQSLNAVSSGAAREDMPVRSRWTQGCYRTVVSYSDIYTLICKRHSMVGGGLVC